MESGCTTRSVNPFGASGDQYRPQVTGLDKIAFSVGNNMTTVAFAIDLDPSSCPRRHLLLFHYLWIMIGPGL